MFQKNINLICPTSKGGSIASMPAWGPRDLSSNPAQGKLVKTSLFLSVKHIVAYIVYY